MVDRTTKILLALIFVALCALYVHLVLQQTADAPAVPPSAVVTTNGSMTYVVSGGYVSVWDMEMQDGKNRLVLVDQKPLPATEEPR